MVEQLLSIAEYFLWFVGVVWVLAAISNRDERGELKDKLSALIAAPAILANFSDKNKHGQAEETESVPIGKEATIDNELNLLYPRKPLEDVAQRWKDSVLSPTQKWFEKVSNGTEELKKGLLPENASGWKIFNYFFLFLLFGGYLYTDAIYVANTLYSMNLVKSLHALFTEYAIAVTFGSLVSIVIGGIIAKDVFGEGQFSDWGLKKSSWTIFAKIFSLVLMVSGFYVVISLGSSRLGVLLPDLPANFLTFLEINGVIAANVITALNAAIATALIADDSLEKGVKVLVLFIISLMIAVLQIVNYIINIITSTVIFIVDIVFRLFFIIKDIAVFIAFTPLDKALIAVKSLKT